ncbi:MAG: small subunit ribosomal protein S2 [Candidatus Midichloriaceae bacterium]|jgi:small subunit ribosomal protein S2
MTFKPNFDIKALLEAGVHYGHKKNLWNPKMKQFIYGIKDKTHIIDLRKTAPMLYTALQVIYSIAAQNGRILFVNTKKQSRDIVKYNASKCGQCYVHHRWLGGMLTNWATISNSIKTLDNYEKCIEDTDNYTKKEILTMTRKRDKLEEAIGGIRTMGGKPDVLFLIDTKTHCIAIEEAKKLNIKIIAVVDTNSNPDDVDYIIPGNDDSRKSIELFCQLASEAALAGIKHSSLSAANAKASVEAGEKKIAVSKEVKEVVVDKKEINKKEEINKKG